MAFPQASSIIPIHTCAPGDLLSTRDGHLADGTGLPAKHARQGPVAQIDYWQANGGVTYQDLDGREVGSRPGSIARPPDPRAWCKRDVAPCPRIACTCRDDASGGLASGETSAVRGQLGVARFLVRDAMRGEMGALRDVFRRSSLSVEGNRMNLLAHLPRDLACVWASWAGTPPTWCIVARSEPARRAHAWARRAGSGGCVRVSSPPSG